MKLVEHLKIGTPMVWVHTDEPERMTDLVADHARRMVYRLDPFNGLVCYKNEKWVRVLVNVGGKEEPTYDFQVALFHVVKNKGCFILYNAHKAIEELLTLLSGVYGEYRGAFWENDAEELPFQLIMMSCEGDVPPEVVRHVAIVSPATPTIEELAEIAIHISQGSKKEILDKNMDLSPLTYAGLGFTESEFVQSCMLSLRDEGKLDAAYIHKIKLDKIKSNGILEIRTPTLSLDDIGGLDLAKEIITNAVWAWNNPQEAAEYGIVPLRRVLMVGVPGTGKSAICEATAKTLGLDLAKTGISQNMNKFIGQSEQNIRDSFRQIKMMAPIVCWMDELGRDLSGSGSANDGGTTDRVHGEFLSGLQELPENVFLMAAANRIDGLPPEMLRADRFDKIMFVGFPSTDEREDIFRIHLGEKWTGYELDTLARYTPCFTGAEIKALINETRFKVSSAEHRLIETNDILAQIPNMRNRIWLKHRNVVIGMYQRALIEWDWASSAQIQDAEGIIAGRIGVGEEVASTKKITKW